MTGSLSSTERPYAGSILNSINPALNMIKNNSATSSKERKNSARGVLINESNQHSTLDKILEKEVDNNESQFHSSVTSSELDSSESSLESSGDDDYEEETKIASIKPSKPNTVEASIS